MRSATAPITPGEGDKFKGAPKPKKSYLLIGFVSLVIVLYISVSLLHYSVIHNHDIVVKKEPNRATGDSKTGSEQNKELREMEAEIVELRGKVMSKKGRLEALRLEINEELEQKKNGQLRKEDSNFRDPVVREGASTMQLYDTKITTEMTQARKTSSHTAALDIESTSNRGENELPGARDRKILSMSDEEFKKQPVSVLMESYGQATGPKNCPGDFGNDLVDRWRATKKTVCKDQASGTGTPSGAPKITSSSIDTYLIRQTRHNGNGDNLIHYKDVSVQMGLFANMDKMYGVVKNYVQSKHFKQPYVPYPRGFVQGQCSPSTQDGWDKRFMPGWNEDWTTSAFEPMIDSSAGGEGGICDEWVDHPVLVLQRDTFANFFHDSEDFINAFLALAILEWNLGDTQVYLTDLYPEGPFWEMWKHAYSQGENKPVRTAWDLKNDFGANKKNSKGMQHRVCFKNLAVGIYGPAAPITVASWNSPCSNTALVKSYADFVIRGMGLQQFTHYAQPKPSKTVTITYMSRRASTVWPEKKFCSDDKSFFLCKFWDHFGIRSLGRMVKNDKDVVAALKTLEGKTYKNGATVKLAEVDFNLLSFPEQIKHDLQTDIMVGPHGAGLMHSVFMRSRATLIELFIDGSSANRHFHNLAQWSGHNYIGNNMANPVNTVQLLDMVTKAIEKTRLDSY